MKEDLQWLYNLKDEVSDFLIHMKGKKRNGFYAYSYSGDYLGERMKWGLGNSVFFVKIVYILRLEKQFQRELEEATTFIKTFQKKNGIIRDRTVLLLSFPMRVLNILRRKSLQPLHFKQTQLAETRQAVSVLHMHASDYRQVYAEMPSSTNAVREYLSALRWNTPWSAGSHCSHLLFFLQHSSLENKDELIDTAVDWIQNLQASHTDGFWYTGDPDIREKINGAMKVMTGLRAVGKIEAVSRETQIIDACLGEINNDHACDNFNITYVLRCCAEVDDSKHRHEDIREFMLHKLAAYKKYYHSKKGGFSFYKGKTNRLYYDALLTKGKNEPDIHGTVLFLWGISVILEFLHIEDLSFREILA